MILTIDIGNTSISLGGFVSDELVFVSQISTNLTDTADDYAVRILSTLSLHKVLVDSIRGAIVSSVVPPLNDVIKKALHFLLGKDPLVVGPGIKSGISIRCDSPASVGTDLIATAVAAYRLYTSPALIIDLGTATKMTVVDQKGTFIGVSIMPGVSMGLRALSEQTAQLPRIGLETPGKIISKNTVDCMRSGILYGHASMIDGMIDRITEEYGAPLFLLATGGMAPRIIPHCRHEVRMDEHLALKGLHLLYQKNHV